MPSHETLLRSERHPLLGAKADLPMIGKVLGPYEITAELGEGGMGEVYRATDSKLKREVAIKVLPSAFTEDPERLARFEREAQLLAQLQHPNIASIYGLEDSEGIRALVMELVEGPTLAERLEQGALPLEDCLHIARQIAEALEEAHEKGIIHRDLKPQNIKASIDGKVKVLDFGLAKAMDPDQGANSVADLARSPTLLNSPTLTAVHGTELGVILGTAAYMAPEQARGGAADKRADIWAFGVVLYEMLSGRSVFLSDTVPDTLAAVLTREVEWEALPASIPAEIRRLLRRCIERRPTNRLRDIGDARIVIDEVLAGGENGAATAESTAQTAVPGPIWHRALPWLGGALVGLLAGILVAPRPADPPSTSQATSLPTVRMLVATGKSSEPDVSPDGRTLAFTSERNGETRIWIKDLASGSESGLSNHPAWLPRFSPDGTAILFSTEVEEGRTDLYRIALATREQRLVAKDADSGDWSPDGRRVCYLRRQSTTNASGTVFVELLVRDLESGAERILYSDTNGAIALARWSPDGRHVAVSLIGLQTGSLSKVGIVDLDTGGIQLHNLKLGTLSGVQEQGMTWLSAQRLALLLMDAGVRVSQAGRIAILDLASGELTSLLPLPSVGWGLDATGDGGLVFGLGTREQNLREIQRSDEGWSRVELLTEGPFSDRQPLYSPDGRYLLFTSDRSGNLDIWRLTRESGELRRLTDHEASDWDPALSPDGTQLLFSSNRGGRFQIWIADADGTGPRQVTELENAQNPTFSGDGEWIVFTLQNAAPEKNGLWRIRPDGRDLTQIANGPYLIPEASPDGRFVAARGLSDDGRRILRIADGEPLEVAIPATDRYRWSIEDGTYLWAILLDVEGNSILRYAFDPERELLGAPETILASEEVGEAESLGVARDGSAIAFSTVANRRAHLVRIDDLPGLSDD